VYGLVGDSRLVGGSKRVGAASGEYPVFRQQGVSESHYSGPCAIYGDEKWAWGSGKPAAYQGHAVTWDELLASNEKWESGIDLNHLA